MGKDRSDFRDLRTDFVFEGRNLIVRILHGEPLVHFEVLLDVQRAIQVLNTDIVDIEIMASRNGANAIEKILAPSGARDGVHHDIGVRKNSLHVTGDGICNLFGALERDVAGHAHQHVHKIAIACATNASAIDFDNTIDG